VHVIENDRYWTGLTNIATSGTSTNTVTPIAQMRTASALLEVGSLLSAMFASRPRGRFTRVVANALSRARARWAAGGPIAELRQPRVGSSRQLTQSKSVAGNARAHAGEDERAVGWWDSRTTEWRLQTLPRAAR
jgi:hypothetical protein